MARDLSTRVTIPCDPLAFGVLRAVAASMGARADLSVTAVQDVCVAVDEVALLLMGQGAQGVSLTIAVTTEGLVAEAVAVGELGEAAANGDDEISRNILAALVDELEVGDTLRFTKRGVA